MFVLAIADVQKHERQKGTDIHTILKTVGFFLACEPGFAIFQNYSNYSEDSHRVKNKQTESFCTTKTNLLSFLVREEMLTFKEPVLGKKNIMLKILKLLLVNPYTEKDCVWLLPIKHSRLLP